jgi:HAT1-interacting factor 1
MCVSVQMEELASPSEEAAVDAMSAPMLVAQALDRELNAGSASAVVGQTGKVNDLTGMVKKKKKADADANGTNGVGEKRKAEDDAPSAPEKRLKVEADDASVAS